MFGFEWTKTEVSQRGSDFVSSNFCLNFKSSACGPALNISDLSAPTNDYANSLKSVSLYIHTHIGSVSLENSERYMVPLPLMKDLII